jgi:ParB family transcriptional regulator, chromosome partitioning protein
MSDPTDINPDRPSSESPHEAADEPRSAPPSDGREDGTPGLTRPTIAVSLLTAHPGNVRRDPDLSPGFLASITENGILVPLRITADDAGTYRLIDGHRRLAAAVQTGLAEVPVDLADDRAGDEPGQFLDMWVAHRHRNPLAPLEEADALFAAREAGATKARIRKATGLKPPAVTAALAAATLSGDTRANVEALPRELTLEDLAILAEFEGDPDAIGQLLNTARWHGTLDHHAERLRQEREEKAEHARLCRELEAAGVTVTKALPPGGQLLTVLHHDGDDLTPESHAGCAGRGAFFRSYDLTTPVHYCTQPTAHEHTFRHSEPGAAQTAGPADAPGPAGLPEHGPSDAARRLVIQGNKAWKAAGEVRKRWLAAHLFPRRTAPREVAQFVAQQLLTMPDPLRSGLAASHSRPLFSEITGKAAAGWEDACATVAAARLPLLMLAPIVTAYEQAMTEGEGKNTWRADRYSPCPRQEAGQYFTFLASIGYQLSDIEQAVVGGAPYTGETSSDDSLPEAADDESAGADFDADTIRNGPTEAVA